MISGALACFAGAVLLYHGATYLLWFYDARRYGACAGSQAFSWRAWFTEGLALACVLVSWPFGLARERRAMHMSGRRPVLLIHGWGLNRASMLVLAWRLRRDGRTPVATNYPSLHEDTDVKARAIVSALHDLAACSPDGRVDVVAHSLGGVLIRAAAQDPDALARIGNVVTLGSPHHGTALAVLGKRRGLLQIRPGSHYLERLLQGDTLPGAVGMTTIASPFDAIVFPTDTGHIVGALNVTIDAVGHHALLYSARVYELIYENLELPLRQAAA